MDEEEEKGDVEDEVVTGCDDEYEIENTFNRVVLQDLVGWRLASVGMVDNVDHTE